MMEWVGSEMKRIQAGGYCRNVTGIAGNYLVPRACLMNMAIFIQSCFPNGEIGFHGRNIFHSDFMIRPCILLNVYRDKNDYREYDLAYIQTFAGKERRDGIGERCVYHDVSLKNGD